MSAFGRLAASLACCLAAAAVILGAFGAHILEGRISGRDLDIFEKAVSYQFFHAVGMLVAGRLAVSHPGVHGQRLATAAALGFLLGVVVFSGSLYLLVWTDTRGWGAVTPLGGLAFIASWILLCVSLWPTRRSEHHSSGPPPESDTGEEEAAR